MNPSTKYSLIGLTISGLAFGTYYLYNLYKEIKQENQNISESPVKQSTKRPKPSTKPIPTPLEITALISKEVEEILESLESENTRKQRIPLISNDTIYKGLVMESFNSRSKVFEEIKKKYAKKYNYSLEELNSILSSIDYHQCERKLYSIFTPKFPFGWPNKQETKEAFIYYYEVIKRNLERLKHIYYTEPQERNIAVLTERMRADDLLYDKYTLSMSQVKYLIYYHDMEKDPEINSYMKSLNL